MERHVQIVSLEGMGDVKTAVWTQSPDNAPDTTEGEVVQPSSFETFQDLQSLVETCDTTYNNRNDIGDGRQTSSEPEGPQHHALLPPDFL